MVGGIQPEAVVCVAGFLSPFAKRTRGDEEGVLS
jgi:hypothetical protein